MINRLLVLCLLITAGSQSYAGAPLNTGKTDPGTLAQQFYQKLSVGHTVPEPPRTNAVAQRFLTGASPSEAFGYSVASAGDVNGDGYLNPGFNIDTTATQVELDGVGYRDNKVELPPELVFSGIFIEKQIRKGKLD